MRSLLSLTSLHCILQLLFGCDNAKKLLKKSDKYSNTPLHIAAKKGFINVVEVCYQGLIMRRVGNPVNSSLEKAFGMFEVSFETAL